LYSVDTLQSSETGENEQEAEVDAADEVVYVIVETNLPHLPSMENIIYEKEEVVNHTSVKLYTICKVTRSTLAINSIYENYVS